MSIPTDITNPGCSNPSNCCYTTISPSEAPVGSASSVCSDGQFQIPHPDVSGTVIVSKGSAPLDASDGERQYLNLAVHENAHASHGGGLPTEVNGDAGGVAKPLPPEVASYARPPIEVAGEQSGVKGLAANVFIR